MRQDGTKRLAEPIAVRARALTEFSLPPLCILSWSLSRRVQVDTRFKKKRNHFCQPAYKRSQLSIFYSLPALVSSF